MSVFLLAQAQDSFLDLGVSYGQVLSELPMLEDLWQRASDFDPLSQHLDALLQLDTFSSSIAAAAAPLQHTPGPLRLGRSKSGWWFRRPAVHSRLPQQAPTEGV